MVYLQYIPDYRDINLIYSEKGLVRFEQRKSFLTEEGAKNFIVIIATIKILFSYTEDYEITQKRFDYVSKSKETVISSLKEYLYAFLKLKINSILVKEKLNSLTNSRYYLTHKTDYNNYIFVQENFIDEISVLRNEELGRYLMRRISYNLNQISKIKLTPYEVIPKIEKENFEKDMIDLIETEFTKANFKDVESKVFIYKTNEFIYDSKENRMRDFLFSLSIKTNALNFEKNFKILKNIQKNIINNLIVKYKLGNNNKKNNKGNKKGGGPKL